MTTTKLGSLAPEGSTRDAIHIAVAPVVSAFPLKPGEHVGLYDDGTASTGLKPIGIVDPFLRTPVMPGERFWLLLYPGTTKDLRHDWSHEAFRAVGYDEGFKDEPCSC